jgi:predicted HTH transcriptional regulator
MKMPADWIVQDLIDLINLKQEESLQLDFKRAESLDSTERKKTEISKDVSAFANSAGGTIVYGIGESVREPHVAEVFSPIDPTKCPKEWLEQVINSRVQPRIHGVLINPVELDSPHLGQYAYVVCIPQSETAHQASD